MSNANGYLSLSLLDELDKKKEKQTLSFTSKKKVNKRTDNTTNKEADAAKKNAVERAVADSLMASIAPKATKNDNHDVCHQVKETSATTAGTNYTTTARRESTVTHTGSGRPFGDTTSPVRTTAKEKRYDDDGTAVPITKENVLDHYDRARELADKPSWSSTERKEAETITKALNRADTQRAIQKTSDNPTEWNRIHTDLYAKTHPVSAGFLTNLYKAAGVVSATEALMNGIGKVTGKPEISETGRQASREIDRIAEYRRQAAPVASRAGEALGSLALYANLADLAVSIPAVAGASSVARAAAVSGAASGGATAVRELGSASSTGEWGG